LAGVIIGGSYGVFLAFWGAVAAAGHGSYALLGIIASPFTLLNDPATAFIGVIALWAGTGGLLFHSTRRGARITLTAILAVHFLCLPILWKSNSFNEWSPLQLSDQGISGFIFYCVGQIIVMTVLVRITMHERGA
jgi:hypothetical protein